MDEQLEEVFEFAKQAHGSQVRKFTGEPYINHCKRVMNTCRNFTHDICILSAALLHDVIEDTPVTEQELSHYLRNLLGDRDGARTTGLVIDLTDVFTRADYPELNRKTRKLREVERMETITADAQTVKYADIIDNSTDITRNDTDFARVYLRECKRMLEVMDKGIPELHEKARHTIEECLAIIKSVKV